MSYHLQTFPNQKYKITPATAHNHTITDVNGGEYLDLTAGGTSFALIGYGNKEVENAIIDQLRKYSHLDCKTFDDPNRELLSSIILNASDSYSNNQRKVFFSGGSGAEAIEMAMHMSYQWHKESGSRKKQWFISRNQSYHGATSGALSIGERPNLEFYRPLQSDKRKRISECNYLKNKKNNETIHEYTNRLIKEFELTIEEIGAENIAAFISETMMGGLVGDVPPTPGYWKGIYQVCKKNNIHLILDEIWCGAGVSGKYNCYEYDEIVPEFLIMGKSLGCGYIPISAIVIDQSFEEIIKSGSERIEMSCTFQGHSTAVAAAIKVQELITSKGFIEEVYNKGEYIRNFLSSELGGNSLVKDIRGRGVRNSLEYNTNDNEYFSNLLSERLLKEKNILLSCKWHRASFSHAMTLTYDEINFFLESFCQIFKNISNQRDWFKYIKNKETKNRSYF